VRSPSLTDLHDGGLLCKCKICRLNFGSFSILLMTVKAKTATKTATTATSSGGKSVKVKPTSQVVTATVPRTRQSGALQASAAQLSASPASKQTPYKRLCNLLSSTSTGGGRRVISAIEGMQALMRVMKTSTELNTDLVVVLSRYLSSSKRPDWDFGGDHASNEASMGL